MGSFDFREISTVPVPSNRMRKQSRFWFGWLVVCAFVLGIVVGFASYRGYVKWKLAQWKKDFHGIEYKEKEK